MHQALHKPTCGGHDYLKPFEVHELEDGRLSFDTEKEAEYPFKLCEVYARATTAYFKDIKGDIIPAAPSCRAGWILNKLLLSTKHLTKSDILDVVLPALTNLINSLSKGNEKEHLHSLLRLADFRGSDVRLLTETLVDGSRQHIPYPAPIWRWECVQSYPWGEKQHINILEFIVFLIYFRTCCSSIQFHSKRAFHVFDSRVCSCVIAKGRSSSKVLNRPLRRYCAFSLAADTYVLPVWTIGSWNFRTRGVASIPLGMVRSVRKPDTRRGHVKYAGLQLSTIRKYNLAIKRFFVWLDSAEKTIPVSLEDLDEAVGEYINHLYQDDLPVGWASDVVCGFKRFYPKCRKSLQISAGYLRNWNKSVSRTQALPLT